MAGSLNQVATVDSVRAYYASRDADTCSVVRRMAMTVELFIASIRLIYRIALRIFYYLVGDRQRLLRVKALSIVDRQQLRAAFTGLFDSYQGQAMLLCASWKRRQIERLPHGCSEQDLREVLLTEEISDVPGTRTLSISHLVGERSLPGAEALPNLRIDRFVHHYLSTMPSAEALAEDVVAFLRWRNSEHRLPPLFSNHPVYAEQPSEEIPPSSEEAYWMVVARLRLDGRHGESVQARSRLEDVVERARKQLEGVVGNDLADEKIASFLRWVRPPPEAPIFRRALRLPLLELLIGLPQTRLPTSMMTRQEERELRGRILARGGTLKAHGVSLRKGGLKALAHIMLEGLLRRACAAPLVDGDLDSASGPHGPYYVLLDDRGEQKERRDFVGKEHLFYLVPGESQKRFLEKLFELSSLCGFLTSREARRAFCRVLTYRELLEGGFEDGEGKFDPRTLAKASRFRTAAY